MILTIKTSYGLGGGYIQCDTLKRAILIRFEKRLDILNKNSEKAEKKKRLMKIYQISNNACVSRDTILYYVLRNLSAQRLRLNSNKFHYTVALWYPVGKSNWNMQPTEILT